MEVLRGVWRRALLLAVIAMGAVSHGGAAQARWEFRIGMENDFFIGFSPEESSDHEYTHGTGLELRRIGPSSPCSLEQDITVSIEQRLYSPRVQGGESGQRRHAGWLSLGLACRAPRHQQGRSYGIGVGVVGPAAGGEWAQRTVHEWFGFREPIDWDRQLPFRPEVTAWLGEVWGLLDWPDSGVQALVSTMAEVGSVQTGVAGQLGLVWSNGGGVSWGLDTWVGAQAVAYDYLLQDVRRRWMVPLAHGGVELGLGRVTVAARANARGRTYQEEPGGFVYGGLELRYRW